VPDIPVCIEVNSTKGYCVYTLKDENYFLSDKEWENNKSNSVLISLESWGEIKKFILKICEQNQSCINKHNKIESEIYNAK
jgi:hypothetical protein